MTSAFLYPFLQFITTLLLRGIGEDEASRIRIAIRSSYRELR
jgi:hypothetical protein